MKILKWVLIIVFILIVLAVIAAGVFISRFDVNQYKERIVAEISTAIDRPVEIDSISFSLDWKSGLSLGLEGFSILEKAPSSEKIAAVKSVQLGVDVASLIKERQLIVTQVNVIEPYVRYVQYADKSTNIDSLLQAGKGPSLPSAATETKEARPKEEISLKDFRVASIDVKNGHFLLESQSADGSNVIDITQLDLLVKDLAAERSFPIRLALNAFSNKQNIVVESRARIDPAGQRVVLSDLVSKIALSSFDLAKLQQALPQLKGLGLESPVAGELIVDLKELAFSQPLGVESYKGEIRLSDGKLKLNSLNFPIENIDALIVLSSPRIEAKDIFMYVASGEIKGRVLLEQALTINAFNAQLQVSSVELADIIPPAGDDYKVTGRLNGSINATGEHHELNPYTQSLKGNVVFNVSDGKIEGLNILRTVVDKLGFIPNLQQNINERLPQKYKDKLKENDTPIDVLGLEIDLSGDEALINNVVLQASGFEIISSGKIDLEQNLYLKADFYMEPELAAAMLGDNPDLEFLLDDKSRMHIPFKPYRGAAAKLKMFPDIENLSKLAIQNKGKQELRKAIFKALDLEEEENVPAQQQPPSPSTAPQEASEEEVPADESRPEEILIESVLDAIFK